MSTVVTGGFPAAQARADNGPGRRLRRYIRKSAQAPAGAVAGNSSWSRHRDDSESRVRDMHDTDTQAALRLRRLSPGPGGAAGRTFKFPVPRRDRDTGIILFKFRVNFNLKDKPVTSLFQDLPAAAPPGLFEAASADCQ